MPVVAKLTGNGGEHGGIMCAAEILQLEKMMDWLNHSLLLCSGKLACYRHTVLMPEQS